MIIYLDLLIIDNFTADFALLYLAVKTVKGKVKTWRLALSSLIGTALAVLYAIFTLYYRLPAVVEILVKYGVLMGLAIIACPSTRKKTIPLCVVAYLAYNFAFAGLLTALFTRVEVQHGQTLAYTVYGVPTGVLVGALVFFVWISKKTVAKISKRKKQLSYIADCEIFYKENKVSARAYMDSGNLLTVNGTPIFLATKALAIKVLGDYIFIGKTKAIKVDVQTVNGKSEISAFKIDKIEIYYAKEKNIIKDVALAISPLKMQGEYDLIAPYGIIGQ